MISGVLACSMCFSLFGVADASPMAMEQSQSVNHELILSTATFADSVPVTNPPLTQEQIKAKFLELSCKYKINAGLLINQQNTI